MPFCFFRVRPAPERSRRNENGFTLIELLVVIAILGLLAAVVAPAVLRQFSNSKVRIAELNITNLGQDLDLYKLDVGDYPSTEDGLQALVSKPSDVDNWNGPYLKGGGVPVDPWNHPYTYRLPSDREGHDYDLCSAGPNGAAGTGGQICNK